MFLELLSFCNEAMILSEVTFLNLGAQSQLVCSGCRNLLLYPIGAASVCCAVCSAVTSVPPPGKHFSR